MRFYQGLQAKPARATNWAQATSAISAEIYGRLMHSKGNELEADNENGRLEPEFYMVFFTANDRNQSWNMLSNSTPALYAKLKKDYPDWVEGFVFGVGEVLQDQYDIAVNTKGDWLFTNFETEVQMRTLKQMIPTNLYGILFVTRDGVPLFGPQANTEEQIKDIFAKVNGLLQHIAPTDPRGWVAEAHYLKAVQPVAYAHGHADPTLIGNPLSAATLKQMKIRKVDATFEVAADGKITSVVVDPATVPEKLVPMFTTGFQKKCLFVPAVDNGTFVAGTYHYHIDVAP